MINLKYKDDVLIIPTTSDEIDIYTFEKLFTVFRNNDISLYDKWISIFKLIGIPDDIINSISIEEFNLIVGEFDFKLNLTKIEPKIKIDGVEYKAYDKEFDITVKDFIYIQHYLDINPFNNITKVLAILYKSKDEVKNKTEFTRDYIDKKALKFKWITANYAIPVYNLLNNILLIQQPNE